MRVIPKAAKKAVPADEDAGETTEESETLEQYQHRLASWIKSCLARAGDLGGAMGRDEYKNSGIVYDARKRVISEFLKSLTKKKCERCGA
jgi:DNA-directed RNA polymerase I subunit RPA1